MELFGTDGIRGVANEFLTPKLAYKVGKALAIMGFNRVASDKKIDILVAGDTRTSTDIIKYALVSGVLAHGANVVDAGVIPTPAVSVIVAEEEFLFGVMITASHNPPEYNGIKIFDKDGNKLSDADIKQLEFLIKNQSDYGLQTYNKVGKYVADDKIREIYINRVVQDINLDFSNLKIAIDCANGATFSVAEQIFRKLNAKVEAFNNQPNGEKINDGCGALNPEFLIKTVTEGSFDLGVAFDGDGDRVCCVLKDGSVLDGDKLMFLTAKLMKEGGMLYGDSVVATILTNFGVEHSLKRCGISVLRVNVGDKNVSRCLKKEHLALGGEKAGHIIVSGFSKTGDGIYSSLFLLKLIRTLNKNIYEELQDLSIYPSSEIDVAVKKDKKLAILQNEKVLDATTCAQTMLGEDGRVVVRASGTENKIRVLVEGKDEITTRDIAKFIEKTIISVR